MSTDHQTETGPNKVSASATTSDNRVELGRINGAYGVHGWVKVFSQTRPMEDILNYRVWQLESRPGSGDSTTVQLLAGRRQGKGIVAQISGCSDRDQAAAMRGIRISVAADELATLDEGEYYWRDLIGLTVNNQQGIELGRVSDLLETGNNDVLVVKGERERLIPYLPGSSVVRVDIAAGSILVDWDADF